MAAALIALFLSLAGAAAGSSERLADRVVLLANSADPDSLAIARHYALVRGVPAANVIALKMPLAETISWREFIATVWQPLEDELVRKGWIDALAMDLYD
ncbi:MAG: TIGR03790 family protein, partial [Opitutaceae bacterium]